MNDEVKVSATRTVSAAGAVVGVAVGVWVGTAEGVGVGEAAGADGGLKVP
ncbi:hypothetical protein [Nocardioides sp. Leaf285]|nr:hypothetical protein [Nocardioides sp. Leaf285]